MSLARRGAAPAVALLVLAGLTGCAHHGAAAGTTADAPSGQAATADSLDGIAQDLQGADAAVSQAGSDVSAGDSAAAQGDAP